MFYLYFNATLWFLMESFIIVLGDFDFLFLIFIYKYLYYILYILYCIYFNICFIRCYINLF